MKGYGIRDHVLLPLLVALTLSLSFLPSLKYTAAVFVGISSSCVVMSLAAKLLKLRGMAALLATQSVAGALGGFAASTLLPVAPLWPMAVGALAGPLLSLAALVARKGEE